MAGSGTETKAPSLKQVDKLVLEFVAAQAYLQSAGAISQQPGESADEIKARLADFLEAAAELKAAAAEKLDEVKARLVVMIDSFGFKHTQRSTRIDGLLTKATSTVAVKTSINDGAVEDLHAFTEKEELVEVGEAIFVKHVSYSLVVSPADVIAPLELKPAVRVKLMALLAKVWDVTTGAPSIKIETMAAAKK